jgi:group I intron endonuclease
MCVLYRHIRLDKNEPFYIGIGKMHRAYSKHSRNELWKKIVAKTDYEVDILFEDLTEEEARNKEVEFIKLYGRIDYKTGTLCNFTDGGEGIINPTPHVIEERRKRWTGNKYGAGNKYNLGRWQTEETKLKISQSKKGCKSSMEGKRHSDESRKKMSENTARAMSRKVIDNATGILYNSITEAANHLNIKQKNLARYLRGDRKNITTMSFLEPEKCFSFVRGRNISDELKERISNKLKKPILVTFLDTNEIKIYKSQKDCCEELDIKRGSLCESIRRGHNCMTKFGKIRASKITHR